MADRIVKMVLTADTKGLTAAYRNASAATKDFASKSGQYIDKNRDSINTVSNALGGFGLAAVGAAGLAVKAFMNFDQAMANVKATGDDARASLGELRDAAIDAGARTAFSATEAANAIEEMAKAGISAADILSGGLDGALDLAAAGQIGVADAAGIAAATMNQFGLAGKDVTHVADVLAAAAGKANGEVGDFGVAMKYVGPVAASLGVSLDETAGALALMAQNGILADSAGTGLRGVMQALSAPTAAAQKEMDKYNISMYDGQGKFIGLAGMAEQLRANLGGLDDATRNAAFGQMFGNAQVSAAQILYKDGGDAIQHWTDQVNDSGYAAEVAATKMDTLAGDWEGFTGALETAMIGAGEGANGPLRSLVQSATDVVNAFSSLPDSVQQGSLAIVGGGGLVALGTAGLGKLLISVRDVQKATQDLGVSFKSASALAGGIAVGLGVAAYIAGDIAKRTREAEDRIQAYADTLDGLGNKTKDTAQVISDALSLKRDGGTLMDWADEAGIALDVVVDAIDGNAEAYKRLQAAEADALQHSYDGGAGQARAANIGNIVDAVDDERRAVDDAKRSNQDKAKADEAAGVAQRNLATDYSGTTGEIGEQVDALTDLIDAQNAAAGIVLDAAAAQRKFEAAIDDAEAALAKNGATLDITTEQGRENEAALHDIVRANGDVVASMRENGATQEEIQGAVQRSRDEFIRMATAMGLSGDDASALADKLSLIPGDYTATVVADTSGASNSIQAWINRWQGFTISGTAKISTGPLAGLPVGSGVLKPGSYATGGYTGDGGKYEPAGVVHKGEYVLTKEATARIGVDRLNNLNYGQFPGYAGGGAVGGNVTASGPVTAALSPEDRALLRAVVDRPVRVDVDGRALLTVTREGERRFGSR